MRFVTLAVSAVILSSTAVAFAQSTGANAFLSFSAKTTGDLEKQVGESNRIKDAYERHFQLDHAQLLAFLRTLRPFRLAHDQEFTVYSLPPNGEFKAHAQMLKKGELVFVDMNNHPILRAKCGNPLVGGPTGIAPHDAPLAVSVTEFKQIAIPEAEQTSYQPLALAPSPVTIPELASPSVDETQDNQDPQIIPVARGISWLPLIGAPIIAGSFDPISGGDLGGGVGPPVPEPATLIILGAGIGGIIVRRRRRTG